MKDLILLILAMAIAVSLRAQDPHFSQFYANRIYLNPAYTALDKDYTLSLNYRDQWFGIPDGSVQTFGSSLRTYHFTGELQFPCFARNDKLDLGVGVTALHDEAGGGPLKTTAFGGAFSLKRSLYKPKRRGKDRRRTKKGKHRWEVTKLDLRVGLQTSFVQKRLDGDFFIYSEQLDPVIGILPDVNILADFNRRSFFNMNAGVMVRGAMKKRMNPIQFTVGLSFSNVNQPQQSLESIVGEDRLPMRYTLHGGFTYRVRGSTTSSPPIDIAPQFRWDMQAKGRLNSQMVGLYVLSKAFYLGGFMQYNFPKSRNAPSVRGSFLTKNTTTLVFMAGVDVRTILHRGEVWKRKKSGCIIGLSYDLNVAGLNSSNTLGAIELSLNWRIPRKKSKDCNSGLKSTELYDGDCPVKF